MPEIEDFTCSREATIAAFEDYYSFLVDLYMDPFEIIYPPEGGWPSISTEFQEMIGKSDEVIGIHPCSSDHLRADFVGKEWKSQSVNSIC